LASIVFEISSSLDLRSVSLQYLLLSRLCKPPATIAVMERVNCNEQPALSKSVLAVALGLFRGVSSCRLPCTLLLQLWQCQPSTTSLNQSLKLIQSKVLRPCDESVLECSCTNQHRRLSWDAFSSSPLFPFVYGRVYSESWLIDTEIGCVFSDLIKYTNRCNEEGAQLLFGQEQYE
jgi:hypothetical protein